MKKLVAIFLFSLFLLNMAGYRIVFFYAQLQSDGALQSSLDKSDYNEAELLVIKVPLALPYITDQANFERVDGEITLKGKIYKYVKRKISGGSLVLLCLPDYNKMRLTQEKNDFFKDSNNLSENTGGKKSATSKNSFKNVFSEYDQYDAGYSSAEFLNEIRDYFSVQVPALASAPHASPERPPECNIPFLL